MEQNLPKMSKGSPKYNRGMKGQRKSTGKLIEFESWEWKKDRRKIWWKILIQETKAFSTPLHSVFANRE